MQVDGVKLICRWASVTPINIPCMLRTYISLGGSCKDLISYLKLVNLISVSFFNSKCVLFRKPNM